MGSALPGREALTGLAFRGGLECACMQASHFGTAGRPTFSTRDLRRNKVEMAASGQLQPYFLFIFTVHRPDTRHIRYTFSISIVLGPSWPRYPVPCRLARDRPRPNLICAAGICFLFYFSIFFLLLGPPGLYIPCPAAQPGPG